MQISEDYAKQLQMMHTGQGDKIGFGVEPAAKLVEVIKAYPIITALDFGCGEGNMMARLMELFPHLKIQGYDPGVERYSAFPESVDLIYLDPPFNSKRFYSAPIGSKSAGGFF
jgi:16S rRNA G966 N2-methylase RsmD